ncbi:hypothetical protein AB0H71_29975 [Nocardia sp. NPDC050697]|uniref:hypothetical protein n=1 Tax=Nocardia sp. NPDC050697 TaxID=3155158 RepID=UPI0033F9A2FC
MNPQANNRFEVKHYGTLGETPEGARVYASVPIELARDKRVSTAGRAVAVYVWSHTEGYRQSAAAVVEALGMSAEAVRAALGSLQANGWLVRQPHVKPGNTRQSFEVWHLQMTNTPFTPERVAELSASVPPPADPTGKAGTGVPEKAVSLNRENRHLSSQFRSAPRSALPNEVPIGENGLRPDREVRPEGVNRLSPIGSASAEPANTRFRWVVRPDAPADIEGDENDPFGAWDTKRNRAKRFILEECQGMDLDETFNAVWYGLKFDIRSELRPGKYLDQRVKLIEE